MTTYLLTYNVDTRDPTGSKNVSSFQKIFIHLLSGVCVSSAGLTCHPKKKAKIVSHDVVLYNANGSQVDIAHDTSLLVCVDTG